MGRLGNVGVLCEDSTSKTPAIKYVGYESQETLKVGVKADCRISNE